MNMRRAVAHSTSGISPTFAALVSDEFEIYVVLQFVSSTSFR